MTDQGDEFSFFQCIHVKVDIRIDISISIKVMTTKFGRQVHLEELTQMRLKQVTVTSSRRDHVTNFKNISTTSVPVTTKHGKVVTYVDGFLPIKSYDPFITWSSEITWQTKTIASPLPQC